MKCPYCGSSNINTSNEHVSLCKDCRRIIQSKSVGNPKPSIREELEETEEVIREVEAVEGDVC